MTHICFQFFLSFSIGLKGFVLLFDIIGFFFFYPIMLKILKM